MAGRLPTRSDDGHALIATGSWNLCMCRCQCGAGPWPNETALDSHRTHRLEADAPVYKSDRYERRTPPVPPPGLF